MSNPIPEAALDQPLCIVGTVGSGKTYAAKSAVERLLSEGRRVIIVDPTGVWHGLRTMADGAPGFPVVIFGGEQADVPVSPDAGAVLGELLADDRVTQTIVDVSEMTGGERTRFLTAMLERLYVGARVPRHLVLDEADEMASQTPLPEQLRLLGIVDKIVRRGRVRGFRPMMITQRPAVLHKNVLSQIATLVAMRLTSPQDRKAVEGWVRGSADLDEAKAVLASLPKLAVGEGWVWAPREGVLERTRFPAIATLDTSASLDNDAGPSRPRAMAPVDVAALREALSLDKPAESKPLARNGKASQVDERGPSVAEVEAAERRGYERGIKAAAAHVRHFSLSWQAPAGVKSIALEAADKHPVGEIFADAILEMIGEHDGPLAFQPCVVEARKPPPSPARPVAERTQNRLMPAPAADSAGLSPTAQRIVDVLEGAYPVSLTFKAAALRAGASPRSSQFRAYQREVEAAPAIEVVGDRLRARRGDPTKGKGDVVQAYAAKLQPSWAAMLTTLAGSSRPLAREEIADRSSVSRTSSGLTAGLKELVAMELAVREADGRYALNPI